MTRALLALALLLPLAPAAAQEAPVSPEAVSPEAVSPEAAVLRLLEVSNAREAFEVAQDEAMSVMAESSPLMGEMRPVLEAFYDEYVTWEAVEPEYVALYLDLFTVEEIEGLTAFYQTELGRRFIEEQGEVMVRSMRIGQELVLRHEAELEARIMNALGAPPPPPEPEAPADSKKGTR